jgi:heme-degrading monooxygenase HmoA
MSAHEAFRVMLRMQATPGQEAEFERVWAAGAEIIAREPASRGQWLARSAEEGGVYYIVSDWTDELAFRTYERSARHRQHRSRLHPYRASGSMTTMNVLRHMVAAPGAGQR